MSGIGLALASALSWGSGDFLSGLMSRRLPLALVLLLSQGTGLPLMALVVGVRWSGGVGPGNWQFVPDALLAALFGQIGLAALFRGMAMGSISIVAPISATSAAVPVLVGLATGERPTVLQAIGVALALAGVALASLPPVSNDAASATGGPDALGRTEEAPAQRRMATGAGFGLLAALGFGLFYVALRRASADDPFWPVLVQRAGSVVLLLAVSAVLRPRLAVTGRSAAVLALAGILDVSANVLYGAASVSGIGGLAAVVASLYPVVTVALAAVFVRERLARPQRAGVVAALAGVALIAWQ